MVSSCSVSLLCHRSWAPAGGRLGKRSLASPSLSSVARSRKRTTTLLLGAARCRAWRADRAIGSRHRPTPGAGHAVGGHRACARHAWLRWPWACPCRFFMENGQEEEEKRRKSWGVGMRWKWGRDRGGAIPNTFWDPISRMELLYGGSRWISDSDSFFGDGRATKHVLKGCCSNKLTSCFYGKKAWIQITCSEDKRTKIYIRMWMIGL